MTRGNARRIILLPYILSIFFTGILSGQTTDPYFRDEGGFGYSLVKNHNINIWWCEGAYKIMKDNPPPSGRANTISLYTAKNETEPFELVISSIDTLRSISATITNLASSSDTIDKQNVEIRSVEYVDVTKPTDSYGFAGLWPDPLPLAEDGRMAVPGVNTSYWFNVYTPVGTEAGIYNGTVMISTEKKIYKIPIRVEVWDFTLPSSPSIRSGFGLSVDKIVAYQNLENKEDIKKTFDLYMQEFRKYLIAPYYFDALTPVKENIRGVCWQGGEFDSKDKASGRYSYKIDDDDPAGTVEGVNNKLVAVDHEKEYRLRWQAMTGDHDQQFCVLVESFDASGKLSVFDNKMEVFTGTSKWKSYSLGLGSPGRNISYFKVSLFPVLRTQQGEYTGITWFDNLELTDISNGVNLLEQGDFEINTDSVKIDLDFSDFDVAASLYLDNYGFNSFRLNIKGLGSGTYYSRENGSIAGFAQGSKEYDFLMKSYIGQIERHLEEKGWINKAYVYWFDEPSHRDYPFVREGMEIIKNGGKKIPTFLTENDPGPGIMDVTDISCTLWNRIDPEKAKTVISNGNEYWSYICTAPKAPWISEFIDHDAINLRMWLWGTWSYGLNGILVWSTNYWNSRSASPSGYLQNPWEEAASYVQGYGWPYGKQTQWGNGDGRFFYPPNRHPGTDSTPYIKGPVPSIRLEFLRQGIEDYEYFKMLKDLADSLPETEGTAIGEAKQLLSIPVSIFKDGKTYTKNPIDLLRYRAQVAKKIVELQKIKKPGKH